jgi:hypothetical protein
MSAQTPTQPTSPAPGSSKKNEDELLEAAAEVPMGIKAKLDPVEKKAKEDEDLEAMREEILKTHMKGLSKEDVESARDAIAGLSFKQAVKIIAAIKSAAAKPAEKVEKPAAIGAPPVPSTQGMQSPGSYDAGFKWTLPPDPKRKVK